MNGPVCLALRDAAESMGADSRNPHSSTARAAEALVRSGTRKAAEFSASAQAAPSLVTDADLSGSDDEISPSSQSPRAMAQRAFSVAASALDASTPSAGFVMDPASGLPIAVLGSPVWMKLTGENADVVSQDISASGTLPARIMWMPRQQALEMSAAKGSTEAQEELAKQAAKSAPILPNNVWRRQRPDSSGSSMQAAASTASDAQSKAAGHVRAGAKPHKVKAVTAQRPVDHPASPIMLDCMYALLRQARGETRRAVSVTHSFLPVANGLPIPARLTIEFVSFKTKGNFPVVMVKGDTSPLASPMDQLLPDSMSFHMRALGASRAQMSYAAGLLTGHREANLPRAGVSGAGVCMHPALAAFMGHLLPPRAISASAVQVQELGSDGEALEETEEQQARSTAVGAVAVGRDSSRAAAMAALLGRGLKRPREHSASSAHSSAASQLAVDGERIELQGPSKRCAGAQPHQALSRPGGS